MEIVIELNFAMSSIPVVALNAPESIKNAPIQYKASVIPEINKAINGNINPVQRLTNTFR